MARADTRFIATGFLYFLIRIRKRKEERLKEQELKMKEKQEKLKEEEQRNPAVEVSVGYDTYDTALSCCGARP